VPVVDAAATGATRSPLARDADRHAPPPPAADAKLPVAITGAWLYMGDDAARSGVPDAFPSAVNSFRFNGESWVDPTVPLYVSRGAYGIPSNPPNFDASKLVFPVALGAVVDVVVVNDGAGTVAEIHPMHLHGHKFWVVGQGSLPYDAKAAAARYDLDDPVLRDTYREPESFFFVSRAPIDVGFVDRTGGHRDLEA
jgi:FtsP/CotA-like multicopper oxidase with cupredoxin domain